jgi:hypothetical protein
MTFINLKSQAIFLRKKGYSYNLISEKLGIAKSTLSGWLKEAPFVPNETVLERIKNGPFISGQLKHKERVRNILESKELAKKELGIISKKDLWMLGIGLYLGEGSKTYETIRVINSDPKIVKLAVKWFKEICGLDNRNITIAIHIYPDNNIKQCLRYWSQKTKIPLKQFRKTQIDTRNNKSEKKKRKLPYGTAHITIVSNGNPNFGVKLHRRIMGWIECALEQI